MEAIWTTLAEDHSNDPGKQAYALKTANMYWQMQRMWKRSLQMLEVLGLVWGLDLPSISDLSDQM